MPITSGNGIADDALREMQINSIKGNAQDIYNGVKYIQAVSQHRVEEILEMTGLVDDNFPASENFKLTPVTDDLSNEGVEDLCHLIMDIKDDMEGNKMCMVKVSKLHSYASPHAYMDCLA